MRRNFEGGLVAEIRVPLRVEGIDLRDDSTATVIDERLSDFFWSSSDGITIASVFTSGSDPVSDACEAVHQISSALAGAVVVRVDEGLVGISDIAAMIEVNRETVRSWITGLRGPGNFPLHRAVLGSGTGKGPMKIWAWPRVNEWLEQMSLDDGWTYLTEAQEATLNAYLARVDSAADAEWKTVEPPVTPSVSFASTGRQAHGAVEAEWKSSTQPKVDQYMPESDERHDDYV